MSDSPETAKPKIATIHIVHLQPNEEDVINPPRTGPSKGPLKTIDITLASAGPRLMAFQLSVTEPPRIAIGATPKLPAIKRPIRTVAMLWAEATITENTEAKNTLRTNGVFRPNLSESGPQNGGPTVNPFPDRVVSCKASQIYAYMGYLISTHQEK